MNDTTIQALNIEIPEVNDGDEHLTLVAIQGIPTPFPNQSGQPVVLLSGIYRIPMGKQAALEVAEALRTQAEKLPDPKPQSNIVIPGSLDDVDQVARNLKKFT